jgi:tetratricopeptide (TPR) repeat protein
MKFRHVALTAAAFVFGAVTSFAQVTTLEGDVKGTDGKPLPNAVILIHRTDIKWDSKTKTDKKGHFVHTGVPLGLFEISCEVDGKVVDKISNYKSSMAATQPIDFDLRKQAAQNNPSRQADIQKAIETGQISDDLKRALSPEQQAQIKKQHDAEAENIKKNAALNESFNAGMTALNAKQWDVAAQSLEKAAEIDPKQPAVWANLGEAYINLAGTKTGPDFDAATQKSLEAYSKALELKPDDPAAHNNYAIALGKAKKYPEMESELKKSAELDPANAFSRYYNLGAMMTNAGQSEAASKAFKMAIDAAPDNPRNAEAYYQYAMSLAPQIQEKEGKYVPPAGLVEALQKYLQLAPEGKNANEAKGMLSTLGGTIETSFKNPTAPPPAKKKKQ